jgi:hypothetical protein
MAAHRALINTIRRLDERELRQSLRHRNRENESESLKSEAKSLRMFSMPRIAGF